MTSSKAAARSAFRAPQREAAPPPPVIIEITYAERLGDTGYLIDQFLEGDAPIANLTNLTVDARFRDINEKPTRRLEAQNTTLRSADALPGGLYLTGEAQNVGEQDVVSAHVGAVFFDAAGAIIGASTSDNIQHVAVGSKEAFETRPGNPLDQTTVANFVVYASPTI